MSDTFDTGSRQPLASKPGHVSGQPERRRKRRAFIAAPIRIRGLAPAPASPDEVASTVNVSRTGFLFLSISSSFHRGMQVAVTFPYTNAAGVSQLEQTGSVVRVSALTDGRVAVAVAVGSLISPQVQPVPSPAETLDGRNTPDAQKQPTILAVESDDAIRDSLKTYLSAEGYKVIAVSNASDARDVLNILTPALLIAQIEGEDLPGYDLCAHIKGTPRLKHIPVMLTTHSAYPTDYSNAHSLGAVVCMAKPYRQERLGHVVRLLVKPVVSD